VLFYHSASIPEERGKGLLIGVVWRGRAFLARYGRIMVVVFMAVRLNVHDAGFGGVLYWE
jgi:hypothetical protein